MSYAKPVKQCEDAPVGFRTINELASNQDDVKELLETEHLPEPEQPAFSSPFGDLSGSGLGLTPDLSMSVINGGRHYTPKVARGSLRVELESVSSLGASVLKVPFSSGACSAGVTRLGVGTYLLTTEGLTYCDVDARPIASDGTATRLIQQTPVSDGSIPSGIILTLWHEATLSYTNLGFELFDYSFQLTLYGYTDPLPAPVPARPRQRSRFSRGPMQWFPSRGR